MRFIQGFITEDAAEALKKQLEDAGVIALVITAQPPPGRGSAYGGYRYLVHVVLDFQFDDAVQLLSNPKHKVRQRVNPKAYHEYARQIDNRESADKTLTKHLINIIVILGILAILLFYVLSRNM